MSILFRRPLPLFCRLRSNYPPARTESQKAAEKSEEAVPVKFSESDAHLKWKARYNYAPEKSPFPPSFRPIYIVSLASFMIYFFILREENDIDERIYQPLWKTVPELEIPLFTHAVEQHKAANLPYADLEAHLKQALERKEMLKNQPSGGKN